MKCASCQTENESQELSCIECGKSLARNDEDLQKVDPKSTAAIGYALGGIGFVALFFVTINLNALSLSGVDYLIPMVLLVLGTGIVLYARGLKK
jgi:hypothetical protein